MYDSNDMKCPEWANLSVRKMSGCLAPGVKRGEVVGSLVDRGGLGDNLPFLVILNKAGSKKY